jgi:histidine triad (HIT) family protein
MSQQPCLLCRIATGETEAQTVLETERVLAIMSTREPQAPGHVVLFARRHAAVLHEMESDDLADILGAAKTIAGALRLTNYNLLHNAGALAGQTVFHAHFHLIPKWSEDEGLRYAWKTGERVDREASYRKVKEALIAAGRFTAP